MQSKSLFYLFTFQIFLIMTKSQSTANNAMEAAPKISTSNNVVSTTTSLGKETSPVNSTTTSSTAPTTTSSSHKEAIPATENSAHAAKESTAVKDSTPAPKEASSATSVQDFVKPKVVDKIFDLPVVLDTYDALVRLSTPLSPYVEKVGALAFVVDQALDFKAGLESKVPEMVKTGYSTAVTKVNRNY